MPLLTGTCSSVFAIICGVCQVWIAFFPLSVYEAAIEALLHHVRIRGPVDGIAASVCV